MKQSLVEIFKEIGNHSGIDVGCNDKNSIHSYLETYDRLFEPFRNGCDFLEIGLASGDSVKLWNKYFQTSSIVGVDLSIVFEMEDDDYNANVVRLISADATKPDIVERLNKECWNNCRFNVILDDADHQTVSQVTTFNLLKHKVKPEGYYIIEDILALDSQREVYLGLHPNCEIIDLRQKKNRFDDVLIIYKF